MSVLMENKVGIKTWRFSSWHSSSPQLPSQSVTSGCLTGNFYRPSWFPSRSLDFSLPAKATKTFHLQILLLPYAAVSLTSLDLLPIHNCLWMTVYNPTERITTQRKGNVVAQWKGILLSTGEIFEEGLPPPELCSPLCLKVQITQVPSGLKYLVTYWVSIKTNWAHK